MGYQALLFCPDDKTARTVTQVLSELEFTVEACIEPFAAVKKLMGQHFDAVVVDCDNEQNATLLFKSARNSTSNQTSLAVAVVEGQAGVAKAFRIGANLVLTKPINIEQAKGTLRVARGLLRKSDPTKPGSATATGSFAVPTAPPAAPTPASATSPTPAPVAAKPAAPKPVPAPRPAPPASLPPRAVAATTTATFKPPQAPAPKPAAPPAWPAAAATTKPAPTVQATPTSAAEKPAAPPAPPAPPALYSAAVAAPVAPKTIASVPSMPSASGAASAPAPAREPQVQRIQEKLPAAAADLFEKPAEHAQSEPAAYVGAAPSFTFGGATQERESTGGSKKILVGVAAALLVVVGGAYFGWSHFKGAGSGSQPVVTSAPVSAPATRTSVPTATTTSTATTSAPVAQPDITLENSETPAETHKSPAMSVASSRPSAGSTKSANAASAPAKAVVAEKPPVEEETPETTALVVKGGKVPTAHATPSAVPDAPAPSLIGMGAPTTAALPNLGTSDDAVKPKLQTLSVSQGVSQGLLYKKLAPSYPSNALRMHIEGAVQLMATISKEGDITHIKVLSGDAQLARAASDAVKQWKYKPYLLNGEPVEIQTQVTVNFKLPH